MKREDQREGVEMSYSTTFYRDIQHGSRISAEIILPPIFQAIRPKTVVDVGCGVGTWLSVAKKLGASCVGFEGQWVDGVAPDELDIRVTDLEKPLPSVGNFDLAMCLEVAEHLSNTRGVSIVSDICRLSDYVLFSAAIPGQGGTNHSNEQWQSWWADLFAQNDFVMFDCVRPSVWENRAVEWWYRQNVFLYVAKSKADTVNLPRQSNIPIDSVHPRMAARESFSLRRFIGSFIPPVLKTTLKSAEREIRFRQRSGVYAISSEKVIKNESVDRPVDRERDSGGFRPA